MLQSVRALQQCCCICRQLLQGTQEHNEKQLASDIGKLDHETNTCAKIDVDHMGSENTDESSDSDSDLDGPQKETLVKKRGRKRKI